MSLDLLYGMCDSKSANLIVTELLKYLQRIRDTNTDIGLRDELVLKIALLAEKYFPHYQWYVDVMLQLIMVAGENMADHVWYRCIKIITNQEDIQEYATITLFRALQNPACNRTVVKVGSYILGEYANLIAQFPGSDPQAIFDVVHSKFYTTKDQRAKAIILSTFVKFINLFPAMLNRIVPIFEQYTACPDAEIQQRACEYLALIRMDDLEMLAFICDVMPAYEDFQASRPEFNEDEEDPEEVEARRLKELRRKEREEAREAKRKAQELHLQYNSALQTMDSQFRERQQQLKEQEAAMTAADRELKKQEAAIDRQLKKLHAGDNTGDAAEREKEEILRRKKEEITRHFQEQAQQAAEMLQQQALLAQQQQVADLQAQKKRAERQVKESAKQIKQIQEAEIEQMRMEAQHELQAKAYELQQQQQGVLSALQIKEAELRAAEEQVAEMQRQLEEDHRMKKQLIRAEAEKQANIVRAQTEQQLAAAAQEMQAAALMQAHSLKEKEQLLAMQEQHISQQMQQIQESRAKEMEIARREAELMRQAQIFKEEAEKQKKALEEATATAYLMYQKEEEKLEEEKKSAGKSILGCPRGQKRKLQAQASQALRQKELEIAMEKERVAAQEKMAREQAAMVAAESQRLAQLAELERRKLAAVTMEENRKLEEEKRKLELAKHSLTSVVHAEQAKVLALTQAVEQQKQEAALATQIAMKEKQQAMQEQRNATSAHIAAQHAQALASSVQAMLTPAEIEEQTVSRLAILDQGVIYKDNLLQIAMKAKFAEGQGSLEILLDNLSPGPFTNFTCSLPIPMPYLTYRMTQPPTVIQPRAQTTSIVFLVTCDGPFEVYHEMHVGFVGGGAQQNYQLKLPITMGRFFDPLVLDGNTFYTRWTQIKSAPQEVTETFTASTTAEPQHIAGLFTNGFRWAILQGVDTNANNLVGAGTFMSSRGSVYCYMRLETNKAANMIRLTVKSGNGELTNILRNLFMKYLAKPQEQQPLVQSPPSNIFATNVIPKPAPAPIPQNIFMTNSAPQPQYQAPPQPTANIFMTNSAHQGTVTRVNAPGGAVPSIVLMSVAAGGGAGIFGSRGSAPTGSNPNIFMTTPGVAPVAVAPPTQPAGNVFTSAASSAYRPPLVPLQAQQMPTSFGSGGGVAPLPANIFATAPRTGF